MDREKVGLLGKKREWVLLLAGVLLGLAAVGCQNLLSEDLPVEQADTPDGDKAHFPLPLVPSAPPPDSWTTQVVDGGGGFAVGRCTSLALDMRGQAHISYSSYSVTGEGDLKYARWTGRTWEIQTVESVDDIGTWSSLALDTRGRPHISCCGYSFALSDEVLIYADPVYGP